MERRLRDLRGRVKAARAAIAGTPRLKELLEKDWERDVSFCARFGVIADVVRHGAPDASNVENANPCADIRAAPEERVPRTEGSLRTATTSAPQVRDGSRTPSEPRVSSGSDEGRERRKHSFLTIRGRLHGNSREAGGDRHHDGPDR